MPGGATTPTTADVELLLAETIAQRPQSVSSGAPQFAGGDSAPGAVNSQLRRSRPSTSSLNSTTTAISTITQLSSERQERLRVSGDKSRQGLKLQLQHELSAAMQEAPLTSSKSKKPSASQPHDVMSLDEEDEDVDQIESSSAASAPRRASMTRQHLNSTNSDEDDFVMLDEIVGSGITNAAGDARVRFLDDNDRFEFVPHHFAAPTDEPTTDVRLAPGHPAPILTVCVRDCAIRVLLFGGSDFGK